MKLIIFKSINQVSRIETVHALRPLSLTKLKQVETSSGENQYPKLKLVFFSLIFTFTANFLYAPQLFAAVSAKRNPQTLKSANAKKGRPSNGRGAPKGQGQVCNNEATSCTEKQKQKLLELILQNADSSKWSSARQVSTYGWERGSDYNHNFTASGDCYDTTEPTFATPIKNGRPLPGTESFGTVTGFYSAEKGRLTLAVATDRGGFAATGRSHDLSPKVTQNLDYRRDANPLLKSAKIVNPVGEMPLRTVIACVAVINMDQKALAQLKSIMKPQQTNFALNEQKYQTRSIIKRIHSAQ